MTGDEEIFNLEPPPQSAEPSTVAPPANSTGQRTIQIQPLHVAVILTLAAIVWIAWPFFRSSPDSKAALSQPAEASGTDVPPLPAEIPPPTELQTGESTAPSIAAEPTQRELEFQSRLETLQATITDLESRISTLTAAQIAQPMPPVTKRRRVTVKSPKRPDQPEILDDFAVNTMYSNQAWLSKGDRTYVVQAGDAIDGIRIVSIDVKVRQVVTDHGVIR